MPVPSEYSRWVHRSLAVIGASAAALNATNVFPVADSDTGSNLELTLAGIAAAVPDAAVADPDAIVRAAVLSAHGNSGAILAEMITSVCRLTPTREPGGRSVARLLRVVATAATRAVARPVAGTILTVADAAADAAERAADHSPGDALSVTQAARDAAQIALAGTPEQLDVLAAAGVVDAGGQAYVLLLDVLIEELGGRPAEPLPVPSSAAAATDAPAADDGEYPAYEVMYGLRGAGPDELSALREELSVLGHSVVVVGDRTVAQVHVHLANAGAAIETGLAYGSLSQVRITVLPRTDRPLAPVQRRTVIAMVAGPGLAAAATSLGAVPVLPADRESRLVELIAALEAAPGDVVVLPNDMESLEIAAHLVAEHRRPDRRIAVIPTTSQIQGLAALAVHEPAAAFEEAVVAMSSTAGHTRHGAVTVAESRAMTMAGRCEVGDVLGLVDGDFTEIGDSLAEVAWRVTQRLLAGGGELLTLVVGADAPPGLVDELTARAAAHGGLEIDVVDGGQRRYPLLVGVE